MNKDQSYGGLILLVSLFIFIFYLIAFFTPGWNYLVIEIPVVLAVLAILGITMWIGWTMLTTPPPAPLEADLGTTTPSTPSTTSGSSSAKSEDKP
jgi:hypothetical protein